MSDREQVLRVQPELPTSVKAMRYAVELAASGLATALDLDRARTWVIIAAELRAGEFQSASVKGIELACPRPAAHMATEYPRDGDLRRLDTGQLQEYGGDIWHDVEEPPAEATEDPFSYQVVRHDNGYTKADETVVFRVPVPDETQVIHRSVDGAECGNCGHAVSMYLSGQIDKDPMWIHNLTGQSVCPVSAPDRPHTFATPKADDRG